MTDARPSALDQSADPQHLPFGVSWVAALSLTTFAALGIRLAFLLMRPDVAETEGQVYIRIGENLAAGRGMLGIREEGLQLFYPPLYPWLLALLIKLGIGPTASAHAISVLSGALLCVPIGLVARAAFGAAIGIGAAVAVAVHPALVVAGASTLAESLYLVLVAGATGLVVVARRPAALAAAGGLAGLAYLVRPEALSLLLLGPALAWFAGAGGWRVRLRAPVAFLAVLSVFVLGYVGYLWKETGRPRLEAKSAENLLIGAQFARGVDQWMVYHGVDTALTPRGVFQRSNLDVIREADTTAYDRGQYLRVMGVRNVARGLAALARDGSLGQPILGLLFFLGLFAAAVPPRALLALALPAALSLLAILSLASVYVFFVRYLVTILPWLLVGAAAGAACLNRSVRDTCARLGLGAPASRAVGATAMTGIAALLYFVSVRGMWEMPEFNEAWAPRRLEYRAAGERLHGPLGAVQMVDTDPTVAFYSGAVFRFWPYADSATVVRYLVAHPPDYIVLRKGSPVPEFLRAWYVNGPPLDRARIEFTIGDTKVYRWLR